MSGLFIELLVLNWEQGTFPLREVFCSCVLFAEVITSKFTEYEVSQENAANNNTT